MGGETTPINSVSNSVAKEQVKNKQTQTIKHEVKKGETVWGLTKDYYGLENNTNIWYKGKEVSKDNNLKDWNRIKEKQILKFEDVPVTEKKETDAAQNKVIKEKPEAQIEALIPSKTETKQPKAVAISSNSSQADAVQVKEITVDGQTYKYDKKQDNFISGVEAKVVGNTTPLNLETPRFVQNKTTGKMALQEEAFKSVVKDIYGEEYYNKHSKDIDKIKLKQETEMGEISSEDIKMIMSDKSSMIGQLMKFNEEHSKDKDLKDVYDIGKINSNMTKLMKENKLRFTYANDFSAVNNSQLVCLDFQKLYGQNKDNLREVLYHQMINSTQDFNKSDDRTIQKQAFTGSRLVTAKLNGEQIKPEDLQKEVEAKLKESGY